MEEIWEHVSVHWQQDEGQLWAICFMMWCVVSNPGHLYLRNTFCHPQLRCHWLKGLQEHYAAVLILPRLVNYDRVYVQPVTLHVPSPKIIAKQYSNRSRPPVYHYSGVIMSVMASQITGVLIVYSTVYSGTDGRKHQSSTSLVFVRGIHRWWVNSPQMTSNAETVSIWWHHHDRAHNKCHSLENTNMEAY